mmetsp:Transcript_9146/g.20206  ORF Transcript_9146/g.20206 Transcript_9146/m.20206 type:complete len:96 (-) Transcript_9146:1127-1414(-)
MIFNIVKPIESQVEELECFELNPQYPSSVVEPTKSSKIIKQTLTEVSSNRVLKDLLHQWQGIPFLWIYQFKSSKQINRLGLASENMINKSLNNTT